MQPRNRDRPGPYTSSQVCKMLLIKLMTYLFYTFSTFLVMLFRSRMHVCTCIHIELLEPGMTVHTFTLNTQEAGAGGS